MAVGLCEIDIEKFTLSTRAEVLLEGYISIIGDFIGPKTGHW